MSSGFDGAGIFFFLYASAILTYMAMSLSSIAKHLGGLRREQGKTDG